jgi:hypothetical protein
MPYKAIIIRPKPKNEIIANAKKKKDAKEIALKEREE